jgi:hypothetical protein
MRVVWLVVSLCTAALCVEPSQATTVFTYTGNNFTQIIDQPFPDSTYTTSMNISGSFTIANPLAPNLSTNVTGDLLSFSFSDGRSTITNLNADSQFTNFIVTTNGTGNIVGWGILLIAIDPVQSRLLRIQTNSGVDDLAVIDQCTSAAQGNCPDVASGFLGFDQASISNGGGTSPSGQWSETPLPAALPLFATGLGALGLLGWRRKRKAAALVA